MTVLRLLGSLLVAAALVLMPTTAVAGEYPGPGEEMVVTETNPEPGEPFETVVSAGADSEEATLTVTSDDADDTDIDIAGTQSQTVATTPGGIARFTVTLHAEGVYTLISYDENMNVIERSQVVVGDGAPAGDGGGADDGAEDGAGAGGTGSAGGDSGAGIGLGDTGAGSSSLLLGGAGVLLLVGGGAALLHSRRRKLQLS